MKVDEFLRVYPVGSIVTTYWKAPCVMSCTFIVADTVGKCHDGNDVVKGFGTDATGDVGMYEFGITVPTIRPATEEEIKLLLEKVNQKIIGFHE